MCTAVAGTLPLSVLLVGTVSPDAWSRTYDKYRNQLLLDDGKQRQSSGFETTQTFTVARLKKKHQARTRKPLPLPFCQARTMHDSCVGSASRLAADDVLGVATSRRPSEMSTTKGVGNGKC